MSKSFVVLGCRAWNAIPQDTNILPTRASIASFVSRMIRGVQSYLFVLTHVFCFCGTHHIVECYACVLLRIFNLVFRALVCSLIFSDAFANGGLLCFIFSRPSTGG
jgi:hypothetical protein